MGATIAGSFPGTANTQQHDINGQPLANCILTVYQGGTTTLADTFQDIGLIIPATNPLVADATGRIPLFFVNDGSYALRLTDQFGVQSNGGFFYPQIPSIGASSSGGGGTPVDPTTVAQTGDVKCQLIQGTIAGWVRIAGRTIGNASSGASERANADCQALFTYIWTNYSQPSANVMCPVVGGIGASALADYSANKQITLLDARGKAIFGLDDMGNAAAGSFTGITFASGNATTGGSEGGNSASALAMTNLPASPAPVTATTNQPTLINGAVMAGLANGSAPTTVVAFTGGGTPTSVFIAAQYAAANTIVVGNNTSNLGNAAPFPTIPPFLLGSLFWKL